MSGMSNEQQRRRCPDDGVCHGSTIVVGSEPCAPGECYRVRVAGPLSGVYPGDRWPDEVKAANGVQTVERPEILVSPGGEVVQRWPGGRWQFVGGTADGELAPDEEIAGWTEYGPRG